MKSIIFVASGGAVGAVSRYLISLLPVKGEFPILTLMTNFIGAVLIGIIVGMVSSGSKISDYQVLFWKTGVCGGFTTFSTFSLESLQLLESGKSLLGILYISVSVVLSLAGVMAGRYIGFRFAVK